MQTDEFRHIGKNFNPPDQRAKVTGRAKYADDILIDGLLHAKTVKSPYAHAEVVSIDTSGAEAMSGVHAVLTYEDAPDAGPTGQPAMDGEPLVFGTPVAAVAAEDEYTAAEAVEEIDVEYRVLDHVIDPVETLKPDGPNARSEGNVPIRGADGEEIETIKWDDADFDADFPENPGDFTTEWSYGDVEAGFDAADVIIEDVMRAHDVPQNPMEPRSNVAHWNNGTLTFWGSTQSVPMSGAGIAGYLGINPADIRYIANYCGGGFGSKATWYPQMAVPALLSMETNRPVKIRGTRKEEFFWGNARTEELFKYRLGFSNDGTMTAADVSVIANAGAYSSDALSAIGSSTTSLSSIYNPENMAIRGIGAFTNTPKKWAMRGPGENQLALTLDPLLDRAADEIGMDRLEFRKSITATHGDPVGPDRTPNSSAYLSEALDKAAEEFGYSGRSRRREGSKVYGIGIGTADHGAGSLAGLDALIVIQNDGTVEVRTGVGNLGTYSYAQGPRIVAETLDVPWEQVRPIWGEMEKSAFTLGQFGSNTSGTTGLTTKKAADTAIEYMQEIAAEEFGGEPDDFEVAEGAVTNVDDDSQSLTFAEVSQIAVELGGKYSGEEIPLDTLNPITIGSAQDVIGQAMVVFSHTSMDDYDEPATMRAYAVAMSEVSVDLNTGKARVEEMVNIGDCGRVINPQSLEAQMAGGSVMGIGYALSEHASFDEGTGIPYNTDWYTSKTPSILDFGEIRGGGVDEPDLYGAYGAKGIGEPPYGSAAGAVTSAVRNALGTTFHDHPITPDMVLDAIEDGDVEV